MTDTPVEQVTNSPLTEIQWVEPSERKDPMSTPTRLRTIQDPVRRASASAKELAIREAVIDDLREIRDEAVTEMMLLTDPSGKYRYRPVDVANAIGVTRAAIAKRFNRIRPS